MTVLVVGAAKGSPGVTTTVTALAATWPQHREPLVVEADPSGGDLVARLASLDGETDGLRETPSTVQLAAACRSGVTARAVLAHVQRLPGPGELRALVGPASSFAAATAMGSLVAGGLGRALGELHQVDVLIDVGRIDPNGPALGLLGDASSVWLVCRPALESVVHTRELTLSLAPVCHRLGLIVVGDRPYRPADVADAVGITEPVVVLPDDPTGAAALAGNARSARVLTRTRLLRAAATAAEQLAPPPVPVDAAEDPTVELGDDRREAGVPIDTPPTWGMTPSAEGGRRSDVRRLGDRRRRTARGAVGPGPGRAR